jgi:hypothetical protein
MVCNGICVIHLVKACNGIEQVERLLFSYKNHPDCSNHDFLFILNGFGENEISFVIESLTNQDNHPRMCVPAGGCDIVLYLASVQTVENKYISFFNSFSEILDDNSGGKLFVLEDVG